MTLHGRMSAIDLQHLRYAVVARDQGSFRRAAESLLWAHRVLGQAVDIAKVVLQSTSILIRLFPVTSETFAKLFSLSSVLS